MRRLGTSFVSLWLAFFGPSLIGWGLWIRASASGPARFHQAWDWLADKLAYPLLFSPLTNWAWPALSDGAPAEAVLAFIVLVALWALVLTVPIIFVAFWWVVLARSMTSSATTGVTSSLSAPSGALYLVTIPVASLWAGVRWVFASDSTRDRPVRRFLAPLIHFALISFLVVLMVFTIAAWSIDSLPGWSKLLQIIHTQGWNGYLDRAYTPRLFDQAFTSAMAGVYDTFVMSSRSDVDTYMARSLAQPDLRTVFILSAARHALAATMVFTLFRTVWWYVMPKETS